MRKFKVPAILFGGDGLNALGVTRNLGRNGVDVYHFADAKNEATFSRYCNRSFIVPKIQEDRERQKNFLAKFEKEISPSAVIFPCSDFSCLNLSSLRNEISDKYHVILPSEEIVETLVNKKKFYQSLDTLKMPHPTTYFPETFDDIPEIGKNIDYPVFVRPSMSQIFAQRFHKKGFVARSKEELTKYCALAARYKIDIMIQEIVPSSATDMFGINGYFDEKSNPRGFFAYRRIREWPHGFGNGSLIESVPISSVSSIKKMTTNYLNSIGYYGLFDAEFKRDSRDGNFKFLEVNARSWWQNSFPTKCGINLVLMAYLDAIGGEIHNQEEYEVGAKWIYFFNDLRSVIKMLRDREISIRRWFSSLRMIGDCAYFSADDPLPCMVSPFLTLSAHMQRPIWTKLLEDNSQPRTGQTISRRFPTPKMRKGSES